MVDEVTLERFFERFANGNPFLENRVNGPAPAELDVSDIHRAAFERLTALARQALAARRGLGAVLWGDAGIGKSHLLARLGRWADETGASFLYLHNLQAAPDSLPRSLLHAVVSQLTAGRRSQFQRTRLYELVRASLIEAVGQVGRYNTKALENAYHQWLDRLGPAVGDRVIYEAFFAFFCSTTLMMNDRDDGSKAGLAVRWLSGGALDPGEARLLGLPPARRRDEAVSLEDAQQIKQVLVALSRLALSHNKPFVLALDQVDNLDEEQFAALARFLEALLDTAPNMLVLTAGVITTLSNWRQSGIVQPSAWDRIGQMEVRLHRLNPDLAEKLVRARLSDFLVPFAPLDKIAQARDEDDLFPLGRAWAEKNLKNQIELRPRDVISLAREGWQQQQGRLRRLGGEDWLLEWAADADKERSPTPWTAEQRQTAIDQLGEQQLLAVRNQLHANPGSLSFDADRLAGVLNDVLSQFRTPGHDLLEVLRVPPPRRNVAPTYHLSLRRQTERGPTTTGVLVMATGAAVAVTAFLRRLVHDSQPLGRLVVVTDERIGMPLGEKGQEYLDALLQRGPEQFLLFQLTFAEHAELEALSSVLGRAKSGALEIEPPGQGAQKVSPAELVASPVWHKRALDHRLLRELAAEASVPQSEQTPVLTR